MLKKSPYSLFFAFLISLFLSSAGYAKQAPVQDILEYLNGVAGMEAEELDNPPEGYRYILIRYEQPIDHDNPVMGTFKQRMVLLHKSAEAPMVLATNGYNISVSTYRYNLTKVLNASQLKIEHRYFAESRPDPLDWQYLTIKQAASDHHRIVQAIRPFYSGKWISRGASKGGMTAMYHRRFFPNDVDGTVANVAPQSFGRLDPRYVTFQEEVGPRACRETLKRYQREVLKRRETMKAYIQTYATENGLEFNLEGGLDRVLDLTIGELYFQFYQYGDLENCKDIPAKDASDQELFDFMLAWGPLTFVTDSGLEQYEAYFYQAITQLGYPRLLTSHLRNLLMYDPNDYSAYVSEWPSQPFDHRAMWDIAGFAAMRSTNVIMIYGDIDPWTAAAFFIPDSNRRGTHTFMVKDGNHGSDILTLNERDKSRAYSMLEDWTGVAPQDPPLMLRSLSISKDSALELEEEGLQRRPL
ncbi:S28 family serine protease [Hahella aquimaris]|uniref:S28 family serine protease n=1 Tax=Hahella sp. HNIBRBA332 TaxID=3015983 RepID=UPI00273ADD11|nr:S28 family serine protease [Hahella sp. HNIBRBA332]WLQ14354.1 S28 family serine protease [Hahella sp. HNIBRBA332]